MPKIRTLMPAITTRAPPVSTSIQRDFRGVSSVASAVEGESASEHADLASDSEAGFGAAGI
jgi:hypothetical protein